MAANDVRGRGPVCLGRDVSAGNRVTAGDERQILGDAVMAPRAWPESMSAARDNNFCSTVAHRVIVVAELAWITRRLIQPPSQFSEGRRRVPRAQLAQHWEQGRCEDVGIDEDPAKSVVAITSSRRIGKSSASASGETAAAMRSWVAVGLRAQATLAYG